MVRVVFVFMIVVVHWYVLCVFIICYCCVWVCCFL